MRIAELKALSKWSAFPFGQAFQAEVEPPLSEKASVVTAGAISGNRGNAPGLAFRSYLIQEGEAV